MTRTHLPEPIREFIARQPVIERKKASAGVPDDKTSPYGTYYHRAVACVLLSGRVSPKWDHEPNMTDVNRFGKEANFNQFLVERVGRFLVAMDAVAADRSRGCYVPGCNLDAFWNGDSERHRKISQLAVVRFIQRPTDLGYFDRPADRQDRAGVIEFLTLFFGCFKDLAIAEPAIGKVLRDFAALPPDDLMDGARTLGLEVQKQHAESWGRSLDEKVLKRVTAALAFTEWLYYTERRKEVWLMASPTGLGMLGLEDPPPPPRLETTLKVQPNLEVLAGAGLPHQTLLPLFRYGVVKKIGEVYELKLDRRRFSQVPSTSSPTEELRKALKELEPLPEPVAELLESEPRQGGAVGVKYCSALVKPADDEVLKQIRRHPKLKG